MAVLVTGGAGFIGSFLVERLLAAGEKVRCLVHRQRGELPRLPLETISGSVLEPESLQRACQGVDTVYHLAGTGRAGDWGRRDWFFAINAEGTRNLLEASRRAGVRRFVFLSSLAVHRFTGHADADEGVPADQERHAYGASKALAERHVLQSNREGLETVIVRPGVVVYGPRDLTAFVHMAPLLSRGRWTHVAGGRPLMCSVYAGDLAEALWLCGHLPQAAGETFVVTDGLRLNWRQFISLAIAAFGKEERTLSFPVPVARAVGIGLEAIFKLFRSGRPPPVTDYRTELVCRDMHFVCHKAERVLGYRPTVDPQAGLARTVAWWRAWRGGGGRV